MEGVVEDIIVGSCAVGCLEMSLPDKRGWFEQVRCKKEPDVLKRRYTS